jgi:hypothetical protein
MSRTAREELDSREKEALRVYRPSAQQDPIHRSGAKELLVRGGKRSGKSTSVVIENVSRMTGIQLTDANGEPIPLRYAPATPHDPKLYWVIGWDVKHIGQTLHRLLFEPGLFRVIRDERTGKWRTYQPADPRDVARFKESEPCGPVIPERLIKPNSWSWENRAANVFESVELINGAKICAFPSSSRNPKMGDKVAGIWIDEDIQNASHVKEWQDRLTDGGGWLTWSVWPTTKNHALIDMLDKAESVAGEEKPLIQAFQLVMTQNSFIPDADKSAALFRMGSDDEIARRDRGELLWEQLSMYDFTPGIHVVKKYESDDFKTAPLNRREVLSRILTRRRSFPLEWTRYLAIDPSHTRTAILVGVVPPPEVETFQMLNTLIIESELILLKQNADKTAEAVRAAFGLMRFEAFVMDKNAGRQTNAGRDDTVTEHYSKAFAAAGLTSRQTKSSFIPGCNDTSARRRMVRSLLADGPDGWPQLFVVDQTTPFTQREFVTYRKKQLNIGGEETILDEPSNPRKHDCMAALEYLVAHVFPLFEAGTAYAEPTPSSAGGSAAFRRAQKIKAKQEDSDGNYVHLGPGAAA